MVNRLDVHTFIYFELASSSVVPVCEFVQKEVDKPTRLLGRDPFNQNSNRSDREKRTTSKGGPVFSKLFRLDRTDPLSFGPKFPEILVEWIAPLQFLAFVHLPFSFRSLDLLVASLLFRKDTSCCVIRRK